MRRIRLYTEQALASPGQIMLEGPAAHHLLRVLRQGPGAEVWLFNGDGAEHQGRIEGLEGKQRCLIELVQRQTPSTESPLLITLAQAVARGERMDLAIQKSVELGVAAIQPVFSERCEVRLDARREARRLAHWQQVVIAACEQSGRVCVPVVHPPLALDALEVATGAPLEASSPRGFYLDPGARTRVAELDLNCDQRLLLAIGPEGGFSERELEAMAGRGLEALNLGPRILRTETAGPAALAMLQSHYGDCRKRSNHD